MRALLSILALYNYDSTVFDNFIVPTGIEKDDVINNLLLELAELEVIYPDPNTMKAAIGFWSKKEKPVWDKLYASTQFDYKPLENLYRTEEYNDDETRNLSGSNNQTRNLTGSNNETHNLGGSVTKHSESEDTNTNNGTDTQKEYVSAFNETDATLAKQTEQLKGSGNVVTGNSDGTDTMTDTGTLERALTDTGTVNNDTTDTGTVNMHRTADMRGSIGVITPQDMIEKERKVVQFNVIDHIIHSFKTRFCIMVY